MRRQWPSQGSYASSIVFLGARHALAVGAGDRCAFSPGRNNFLLVTVPMHFPGIGGLSKRPRTIKGQAHSLAPVSFWWSWRGSNSRPLECHSSALPAELQPHEPGFRLSAGLLTRGLRLCQHIYLDIYRLYHNNQRRAGVVKLVDAGDSKSPDSCSHVGSIPTSGTRTKTGACGFVNNQKPFFLSSGFCHFFATFISPLFLVE